MTNPVPTPAATIALTGFITDDALFAEPYFDVDEWRDAPVHRRYVHGGFAGTEMRFSAHLPPAEGYEGRFFQYITPVPDSEHFSEGAVGEEDKISFAIESGAIFLETNGGGSAAADPLLGVDRTIAAYRANAAAAAAVRALAQEVYGPHRTYGYAFGGSGGGFRTIGGAENTTGVWDGFVPFVIGSPMAIPNCFTARMHALRVVGDRFADVVDALEPGGSGDPFATLDEEQAAALREVTRMGFPSRSWIAHRTMGMHALAVLYPGVRAMDLGYFDDFWSVPGYLGADGSPSLSRDHVQHGTTVAALLGAGELEAAGVPPISHPGESTGAADDAWRSLGAREAVVAVRLATAPDIDPGAAELIAADGSRLVAVETVGDVVVLGPADPAVVAALRPGDPVVLDNSGFLALQTYHRHQVPGPEFAAWDQFRDDLGAPLYPQRPFLIGPLFAAGAAGTVQRGDFEGRMIVVESLLDREAYPWQADWYRSRVQEHLGDQTDDRFRLWMTDNALHGDLEAQEHPAHTVSYLGVLHQALRDVAAWVERGVAPPDTTSYRVHDAQVLVPESAAERRGIQPVATLRVQGAERADVRVGEEVVLSLLAETPGVGFIVSVEWDLLGVGAFEEEDGLTPSPSIRTQRNHVFTEPGTYFPTVRIAAHREGDAATPFARLQNIARVRVVVA